MFGNGQLKTTTTATTTTVTASSTDPTLRIIDEEIAEEIGDEEIAIAANRSLNLYFVGVGADLKTDEPLSWW